MVIPRTITKEVFCLIFSVDGVTPISYHTFFSSYVRPYLSRLGITEAEYRGFTRGLPYSVGWELIKIHRITNDEIHEALKAAQKKRRSRRRIEAKSQKNNSLSIPFPS